MVCSYTWWKPYSITAFSNTLRTVSNLLYVRQCKNMIHNEMSLIPLRITNHHLTYDSHLYVISIKSLIHCIFFVWIILECKNCNRIVFGSNLYKKSGNAFLLTIVTFSFQTTFHSAYTKIFSCRSTWPSVIHYWLLSAYFFPDFK